MNQPYHPIFVLLSLVFIFLMVAGGVLYGLGNVMDVDFMNPSTSRNDVDVVVIQLLVQSIFLFIIPAVLTIYLFPDLQTNEQEDKVSSLDSKGIEEQNRSIRYFSFKLINKPVFGLVVLLFVVGLPIVGFLSWLNIQIPLSQDLDSMESSTNALIKTLIRGVNMPSLVLLMGLLPAIGEELFFRGALQKGLENWTKKPHIAIFLAALIFSAFHMQFAGFLPRLFLGVVLGYAYYFSGNFWVPVLLHFVFNGAQAVLIKGSPELIEEFGKADAVEMPSWWLITASVVIFTYIFMRLLKGDKQLKNQGA